jgi:O-Antigen ligase
MPVVQNRPIHPLLIGYAFLITVLLFLGGAVGGKLMIPLFPLMSVALGVYFYTKSPLDYIQFVCLLTFFAPVIRRIIDYRVGALTFGPWFLTSLLVMFICAEKIFRDLPKVFRSKSSFPFFMCLMTIVYGAVMGKISGCKPEVLVNSILSWGSPVVFGYFIYSKWHLYAELRKTFQQVFTWGCLLMGSYGIYQYLVAPDWDRFWLTSVLELGTNSFGTPEPLGIRVSSTMNSPQAFATVIMSAVFMALLSNNLFLQVPAIVTGIIAFFLSMARAVWLGSLLGLPVLLLSLRPKLQMRFASLVLIICVCLVPIWNNQDFNEVISKRFESFSNLESDTSYNARTEGYNKLFSIASSQLIGEGFGASFPYSADFVVTDSAIFPMMFLFGWVGSLPYLSGIMLLFMQLFHHGAGANKDPVIQVSKAAVTAILAQAGFNFMFVENMGFCLWVFIGLGLAGRAFHESSATTKSSSPLPSKMILPIGMR